MYIKGKWFGLIREIYASENEQDIIAHELWLQRKPVYKGIDAETILDFLNDKLAAKEAHNLGNNEYELMRKLEPKETRKALGKGTPKRKAPLPKLTSKKKVKVSKNPKHKRSS